MLMHGSASQELTQLQLVGNVITIETNLTGSWLIMQRHWLEVAVR